LNECIAVQNDADFEAIRDDCQALTRYRVEFIYPGPFPEQITIEEARSAIQKAHNIYGFIRQKAEASGYLHK